MAEIICGGFGGQGILTTGMSLANIGVDQGLEVSWSPSYGSEMRGGTANCNVIITDDEVGSPTVTYPDLLVVMNNPALEKFANKVRPTGSIIIDSSIIPEDTVFPDGVKVYSVEATNIANEMANPRGANVVMLGTVVRASGIFDKETAKAGMNKFFDNKCKNRPVNGDCFEAGYEKVKQIR